ncbi:MAG: hypothetical protein WB792_11650 [Desulfobacterales bacterium]
MHPKAAKKPSSPPVSLADDPRRPKVPPNGGIKAKYFFGALLYGAKIQNDAFLKICTDLRTLIIRGAFTGVREALLIFTVVFANFSLILPSGGTGLPHVISVAATQPADKDGK